MPLTLSTTHEGVALRLRSQPWSALVTLGDALWEPLRRVLAGQPADRVLDGWLRANRALMADQRRLGAEALFGVGLWRRRLAWHAGMVDPAEANPRALLFCLLRDLAGIDEASAAAWTGLAVLPPRRGVPEDLALRHSLPDWLALRLVEDLGTEGADAYARAISVPGPISARLNPLREPSREVLLSRLRSEGGDAVAGAWSPLALELRASDGRRPNIYGLQAYREGLFEVQDEGSQLLGALVEASPGEDVLDYCAGAGGKSLHLAAQLQNRGVVHVFDIDSSRLERLLTRAGRAGASCIRLHRTRPGPELQVDRVLVDAPCSEVGALRRGPDLRFRLDPEEVRTLPARQKDILAAAAAHVRPGGTLVYATCTVLRAENEDVALAFEASHPDFQRARPGGVWLPETFVRDGFFHALPQLHGTDGFFAAVWRRRDDGR